mmetsp:Transcript_49046/g.153997  ORF Transcript_49046/g.153997 Transcript_49046/m.153997 type:complete len:225 (-) Transcript_49046:1119-1793(-)
MKGVAAKDEMAVNMDTVKRHSIDGPNGSISYPVFELQLEHGNDPEFEAAAREYGEVETFHGSSLENFHCILRCGLKSFSGNKERMSTGDVFGEGVYLSSDIRLASSFAKRGMAWEKSSIGKFLTVVACCRVVLHPSVKRRKETVKVGNRPMDEFPHTYYVVREPRYIMTTSLIIFADGKNNDPHVPSAQQRNQNLEQAGRWPNFSIVLFVLIAIASMVARWVWS